MSAPRAALLLAAFLLCLRPAAGDDRADWKEVRNEAETVELKAPPGWMTRENTNPNIVLSVEYKEAPYAGTVAMVCAYPWTGSREDFQKFAERDVGGTPVYAEGSRTRFRSERKIGENEFVFLADTRLQGETAFYVRVGALKAVFAEKADELSRIVESLKILPPPKEPFQVPEGWKAARPSLLFQVMGPSKEIEDVPTRERFEARLAEVAKWLSEDDEPIRMVRTLAADSRPRVPRSPVHVLPTAEAFKAACGDAWAAGRTVAYLPEHPERIVVVDGSPEGGAKADEVAATAGLAYFEGRTGKMPPWLRPAWRTYLLNGFRKGFRPGRVPEETAKHAGAVFAKSVPSFEAVLKMDEAAVRALDDAQALVPWGYLQYGLQGGDTRVQDMFRMFLKESAASGDAAASWEKAVADFKEQTKKPFRPKDLDAPTKAYLKELASAPSADDDEWQPVRDDKETFEIRLPPGHVPKPIKKASIVISVEYKEPPFKGTNVLGYTYDYKKDFGGSDEAFKKFVEADVGGQLEYAEGSRTRFKVEKPLENVVYVYLVDRKVVGNDAYYLRIACLKEIYEANKEAWTRMLDSMRVSPSPPDPFSIPPAWKTVKPSLMFHVMGPARDVQDPKARDKFEGRLAQINVWLDESDDRSQMMRRVGGDERKWMRRRPIHVFPTTEAYKAACGDAWIEGSSVAYLPDHPERIVAVDGSPESMVTQDAVAAAAGVSYLELRYGKLAPWLRSAFHTFLENGLKRNCKEGLFPDETVKAAAAAFSKNPPSFEAILKMDEAAVRGLDEGGRLVLWGHLQFGLGGDNVHVRELYRAFLEGAKGSADSGPAWEKAVAAYKEKAKKPFKPKELDSPVKTFIKDLAKKAR